MSNALYPVVLAEASFSIVCPVYNSRAWVQRTLESVLALEVQPLELLIIDDGSSDGTPEFIGSFLKSRTPRFTFSILRHEHRGPGAARNVGIRAACGEWIAFLDSDDIWFPQKLAKVQKTISRYPDANFICHHEEMLNRDGSRELLAYAQHYNDSRPLPAQLYQRNLFSTSAVTCKRELLLAHGLFDETLMSAQDYELWLRLSPQLRVRFIAETLGQYVERQGNITTGNWRRRMKNELTIAGRHRQLVSPAAWALRLLRVVGSYYKRALLRQLAGNHKNQE